MTYKETLDYLYRSLPMYQRIGNAAYKADLENAFRMDEYFEHQHRYFKSIHVAGTNGKGSVCHMLASVLQSAGYKTGLFTSPHLLDFRERIKVNGKCIPRQFIIDFTNDHKPVLEEIHPSFFEMTVFMAFDYFKKSQVDIAVIEVGLGGRLDTTNLITPDMSVITNIGLDHTQLLGNTLQEIAREKAGIIKKDIPVVIGETQKEIKAIFTGLAEEKNCPIWFADEYYLPEYSFQNFNETVTWYFNTCYKWNFKELTLDLQGYYQKKNLSTVLMVLWILSSKGIRITRHKIVSGLREVIKTTGFQGRWQIIQHNPLIVCDTAHNKEGFEQVMKQIHLISCKNLFFVLGFVNDKHIDPIADLLPKTASYHLSEPDIPRAMKLNELESYFQKYKLNYSRHNSVPEAYLSALDSASPNDLIYIGGSTFVVADFLAWKKKPNSF